MAAEAPPTPVGQNAYREAEHVLRVKSIREKVLARPENQTIVIHQGGEPDSQHFIDDQTSQSGGHHVSITQLRHFLSIDRRHRIAYVESGVGVQELVDTLLPFGLLPEVLPESPGASVLDFINGNMMSSSSHKFGSFTDTVESMEVVLGDGRLVVAARDSIQYGDLFSAICGGLGTMGIVTAVAIRLTPAARFVRNEYFHFDHMPQYYTALKMSVRRGPSQPSFVEGFQFSNSSAVLVLSSFVNTLPQSEAERTQEAKCTFTAPTATTREALGRATCVHQDNPAAGSLPAGTMITDPSAIATCVKCSHFWSPLQQDKPFTYQHALQCAVDGAQGKPWAREGSLFRHILPVGASGESAPRPGVDYMTTASYFARHRRGALWTTAALQSPHVLQAHPCSPTAQSEALQQDRLAPLGVSAAPGQLTAQQMQLCFVEQDTVWRLDSIAKAVQWVQQYMQVWPLWHRPEYMPASRPVGTPSSLFSGAHAFPEAGYSVHMVLIGEPRAAAFANDPAGTLQQLQLRAHLPCLTSRVFLSPEQLHTRIPMDTYHQLRSEYGADGAFLEAAQLVLPLQADGEAACAGQRKPLAWRSKRKGTFVPIISAVSVLTMAALGYAAGRLLRDARPQSTGASVHTPDGPDFRK